MSTKIVNGVPVTMSAQEEADLAAYHSRPADTIPTIADGYIPKWDNTLGKYVHVAPDSIVTSTGGVNLLKKTVGQVINGTAYQNITGLTFPVEAGKTYAYDFYIVFRSVTLTTGFRFSVNGPAGAGVDYLTKYQTVANASGLATWLERHDSAYEAMPALTAAIAANANLVCTIRGMITVGATPGTFAARVASELPNNDLSVMVGSHGTWWVF